MPHSLFGLITGEDLRSPLRSPLRFAVSFRFIPCVMLPTLQMLAARYEGTEQDRSRGRSDRVYRRV